MFKCVFTPTMEQPHMFGHVPGKKTHEERNQAWM